MKVGKTVSIHIVDTGDNYPIHYVVSNRITRGLTTGWHLVELLNITSDKEFTFRYAMIDQFISALQAIKGELEEE